MCKLQYGFGNHSRDNKEESFKLKHDLCLGSLMAQTVKNLPAMQETQVRSLGQEDPLEKGMATHSSILAWRIPWQRSLESYNPWGSEDWDTTERLALLLSQFMPFCIQVEG